MSFCMNLLPFSLLLDYKPMYVAFGFTDSQPVFIGLIIVMMYILTPVNTVSFRSFFSFLLHRILSNFLNTFSCVISAGGIFTDGQFPEIRVPGRSIWQKTWSC